jgi:predicted transcriptional regulator
MSREQNHTEKLNFRIDPALRAEIERIAETKDRPVAWVIRDALARYADQETPSGRN